MTFTAQIIDRASREVIAVSEPSPDALAAWRWLRDERQRQEDDNPTDVGEYSDVHRGLDYISSGDHPFGDPLDDWGYSAVTGWGTKADGTGVIPGDTPAKMNSHGETPGDDLGLDYMVKAN